MEKGEPMSILIKGIDIPSKEDLELFGEDSHIVIGGHLYPIELDQLVEIPTIQYEAFTEFERLLLKKIENYILYGEEGK